MTTDPARAHPPTPASADVSLTFCRCRCVCRSRVCRGSRSHRPRGPCPALSHHAHPGRHHALLEACLPKAWGGGGHRTRPCISQHRHWRPQLPQLPAAVGVHSLVHRELSHPLGLVLGGLFEAALSGSSPLRPLVSRSAFALAARMLRPWLALLVWSSAHPPDTLKTQKRNICMLTPMTHVNGRKLHQCNKRHKTFNCKLKGCKITRLCDKNFADQPKTTPTTNFKNSVNEGGGEICKYRIQPDQPTPSAAAL